MDFTGIESAFRDEKLDNIHLSYGVAFYFA
jgi:hypothetical protein